MGAANVAAALALWAGKVPYKSMVLLLTMALVSRDADAEPWYGQGHEALAIQALGRLKPTKRDIHAVEEGVSHLLKAGAIVADRRPAPRRDRPSTVRYRLQLHLGATVDVPGKTGEERPRKNRPNVPGKTGGDTSQRPRKNRPTSPEKPGTEEKEEEVTPRSNGGVGAWGPPEPEPHAHAPEAPGDPYEDDRPPSDPAKYLEWMRRHRPNSPWLRSVK